MKTVRMGLLFDFYGVLLTDRQQRFFSLYFDDDLSLGEIAEQYEVSRQAVYDMLRRAGEALEGYEKKLRLVERFYGEEDLINDIARHITHAIQRLQASDAHGLHDVEQLLDKASRSLSQLREIRLA